MPKSAHLQARAGIIGLIVLAKLRSLAPKKGRIQKSTASEPHATLRKGAMLVDQSRRSQSECRFSIGRQVRADRGVTGEIDFPVAVRPETPTRVPRRRARREQAGHGCCGRHPDRPDAGQPVLPGRGSAEVRPRRQPAACRPALDHSATERNHGRSRCASRGDLPRRPLKGSAGAPSASRRRSSGYGPQGARQDPAGSLRAGRS